MHKVTRLLTQALAFLAAFIGISWLLNELTLVWQEALLILGVYMVVTWLVEAAFARAGKGTDNG